MLEIPVKVNARSAFRDDPAHHRKHLGFEVKLKRLLVSGSRRHFSTLFAHRYSSRPIDNRALTGYRHWVSDVPAPEEDANPIKGETGVLTLGDLCRGRAVHRSVCAASTPRHRILAHSRVEELRACPPHPLALAAGFAHRRNTAVALYTSRVRKRSRV